MHITRTHNIGERSLSDWKTPMLRYFSPEFSYKYLQESCWRLPIVAPFHGQRSLSCVCWLLDVPATRYCISGTDLLRQLYILPHWDNSCRLNLLSRLVTLYYHRVNQTVWREETGIVGTGIPVMKTQVWLDPRKTPTGKGGGVGEGWGGGGGWGGWGGGESNPGLPLSIQFVCWLPNVPATG